MSIVLEVEARAADRQILSLILTQEEHRHRALMSGDVILLKSIFDNDAVYIHSCGMVDSEDTFVDTVRRGQVRYQRVEIHIFRIKRMTPSLVMLSGAAVMNGIFYGQRRQLDELFSMCWLKRRDGWKLSSFQSTALDTYPR